MRWALLFATAACSSSSQPVTPDAAHVADAAPDAPPVVLDTNGCPVGMANLPTMTITDAATAYTPVHLVLVQGQYAKFVTSSTHDMHFNADPANPTAPLEIPFSTTRCLHFQAGHAQYLITCTAHGEMGDVLVSGGGA